MDLDSAATEVAKILVEREVRLVLAESCTGGLAAATLAQIPGASSWLAGSMVVYQEASKSCWLGVDRETLSEHTAASAPVAHQMAMGALQQTPHADLALAVTGHLGPNAPADLDGCIFLAICKRDERPSIHQVQLTKSNRMARQREATLALFKLLISMLT
ncbi:MAG: CinA family protein [Planctomycetota bacterium]